MGETRLTSALSPNPLRTLSEDLSSSAFSDRWPVNDRLVNIRHASSHRQTARFCYVDLP
ncbi:hypothetical protein [Bradyrhizobium sp. sGM-13]|uniref:hypothetical protein n=1 Tax=Bradyrhizobium sp. sGM-13 TaxID=2831781 RepID=UPI001BD07838|nr:hypothetical protein [Bradyrhizobium sp. sGM-13]